MLRRVLRSPSAWLTGGVLVGAALLYRQVQLAGGPEIIAAQAGCAAPPILIALLAALSAAPLPTEVFAVANAAVYGWVAGTAMTWAGWTLGSMIQYGLARRGAVDAKLDARVARLPGWARRFPLTHPMFLIGVRWLPMGFHLANIAAGARRVPVLTQLGVAAAGSLPVAAFWATAGAGLAWL